MAANKKTIEALSKLIQECVREEIANLNEGTIGGIVIEPLMAAIKNKDMERARRIFQMSLKQFSADEIETEVLNRIKREKDKQNQYVLNALAQQYGVKKGAGIKSPSAVMSAFEREKRMAGANQASLPATRVTASIVPEHKELRAYIVSVIKEIAAGLKHGSSAGVEARAQKMKAVSAAKQAPGQAAAPAAPQAAEEPEVVASQPAARKPVPPPIPAAAQKPAQKKPGATPPPVPSPNYASQVKKVAMNEDVVRNLVRAIMMSELGK